MYTRILTPLDGSKVEPKKEGWKVYRKNEWRIPGEGTKRMSVKNLSVTLSFEGETESKI
jgi:hypothetical protein